MSQYDVPENDAREIMLLPKEGEPTDWIANDGSENVISIAFPAVVTKGPPLSGLKVVFDYKYLVTFLAKGYEQPSFKKQVKRDNECGSASTKSRSDLGRFLLPTNCHMSTLER